MGKPTKVFSKGKDRKLIGWRIRVTDFQGKRISKSFPSFREAELEQKRLEIETENIKLGLLAPQITDKTVADICDHWEEFCTPRKRDGRNDRSIIKIHIRPELGSLNLRELNVAHTDRFQLNRKHLQHKTVANILTLLISMLNRAVELRWLERCPRIKKPKTSILNSDYRFLRTQDEVDQFLRAAADESELAYVLYATAIYTGMRQGEIAGLMKSSVDFQKRLITVLGSFHGQTKSGDIRYVPILDPLMPILQKWFLKTPGHLAFPNQAGNMHQQSDRIFQEALHRILKRAGFPMLQHKGKERRYIRFHDLRHTFASQWVMAGGDIFKLQKILGHKSIQMTQRYSHLAPHAFAGDYGRLGKFAASIEPAQVIAMKPITQEESNG